jgi:hypothetical protein
VTASSPTLALVPGTHAPGPGASTGADHPWPGHHGDTVTTALRRAAQPGYFDWLDHVWSAAGCSHPVRLHGDISFADTRTGQILRTVETDTLPDRMIYKACGNRRTAACPSCAETYRRDAYHIIRSGLAGGKGVTPAVAGHPAVFATFTAPSFGPVHTRLVRKHTCTGRNPCRCRAEPCHARRDPGPECEHGNYDVCFTRHPPGDPALGTPLCPDCYDYDAHAVWNNSTGELWRRTKQAAERYLAVQARRRRIPFIRVPAADGKYRTISPVRISHGKAAEFQARGAVHFHALLRLDGIDPDDLTRLAPPPAGITVADLDDAVRHAAATITCTTPGHEHNPAGWHIAWGTEIDVRVITMRGSSTVTDAMVAAYLAKYATKSTEATGHISRRLTPDTIDIYADPDGTHAERLIDACWTLGRDPAYRSLRRWAHMLGFGGHFLTKARRYSLTFRILRDARQLYRRTQTPGPEHGPIRTADHTDHDGDDTIRIVANLWYAGTGWKTFGDALLANTAADLARRRREAMREDLAHEAGTVPDAHEQAA